jgi:hypothetical protein
VEGIALARRQWPWAGVFAIWYFRQPGLVPPDRSDYYFRLVDVDFTPRLAYHAIKEVAPQLRTASLGYHQESSPAVQVAVAAMPTPLPTATPSPTWQTVIAPQASGQALLESSQAGARLTFTFRGDGLDLIALRDAGSGRLLVTLDGRPVAGLPQDKMGRSYVDLYNPTAQWQSRIPLVRGAGSGQHVLGLTVGEERHPQAEGNQCTVDAFVVLPTEAGQFPYVTVALLALGLALAGWGLVREWRRTTPTPPAPPIAPAPR